MVNSADGLPHCVVEYLAPAVQCRDATSAGYRTILLLLGNIPPEKNFSTTIRGYPPTMPNCSRRVTGHPQDVILELHGSNSTQMLHPMNGNLGILNVGSGPALNVKYDVVAGDYKYSGTIFHVFLKEPAQLLPPLIQLRGIRSSIKMEYESLSSKRYRTLIEMNDYVLLSVKHEEL
jgi:hypothetical protein